MKESGETLESAFELHSSPEVNSFFAPLSHNRSIDREPLEFPLWGECLSEVLGTMVMVACGTGVVAQEILTTGAAGMLLAIFFSR
jgi:hypothetical protein